MYGGREWSTSASAFSVPSSSSSSSSSRSGSGSSSSSGSSSVQKEAEKKLKYKSLCIEIRRMWNLKCTIVPGITGATGIVTRSLRENLEAVPGKHSIDSLRKTAILGTSHPIRKVLQCEA